MTKKKPKPIYKNVVFVASVPNSGYCCDRRTVCPYFKPDDVHGPLCVIDMGWPIKKSKKGYLKPDVCLTLKSA